MGAMSECVLQAGGVNLYGNNIACMAMVTFFRVILLLHQYIWRKQNTTHFPFVALGFVYH